MGRKLTAGARLRRSLDAGLKAAAQEAGVPSLEWSEAEVAALAAAVAAEDRREVLAASFTALAAAEEADPARLAKLSAELRQLEKAVSDAVGRLSFGEEPAKSQRHVRAARRRWEQAAALRVVGDGRG